jgi:hypothetical protein
VIALLPLLEIGAGTEDRGPVLSIGIRLRIANLAVAVVAIGLGGLLVAHIVVESVLGVGA